MLLSEASAGSSALEEILSLIPGPESFTAFHSCISVLNSMARSGGADIPPRLDSFLDHKNLHVRLAAAVTLARCFQPTERSTAVIRECLEPFQPDATNYVLQVLKEMNGDKSVFLPQLVALVRTPNRVIASGSASAIGQMGKAAVPAIKKFLSDEDPEIRRHGGSALYQYVTVAKAEPITWPLVASVIPSIAKENPRQAVWILNQFPEEIGFSADVVALLRKLAESAEPRTRNEATQLLRRIPPTPLR